MDRRNRLLQLTNQLPSAAPWCILLRHLEEFGSNKTIADIYANSDRDTGFRTRTVANVA